MSLSPQERQALFLELAQNPEGVTAQDVFDKGNQKGDQVSIEAYYNLGRRLKHRGMLKVEKKESRTVYFAKVDPNATWLDEEHIASVIDPEYPLPALTAWRESLRQIRQIPDEVWIEARHRLFNIDARQLFIEAITSYADNLKCEIEDYARERAIAANAPHLSKMRRSADKTLSLLIGLCKYGLGLSKEAIALPVSVEIEAETMLEQESPRERFYNPKILEEEISRRIEPGSLIRDAGTIDENLNLVIAGVDGSTIGGLLSLDGISGDFSFGQAPQVSINTSTGVLNRNIKRGKAQVPAFLRLPEKPEDMQQRDNRYSIMAKMFYPDLTDSEYVHSTWNAMDLLECRNTLNLMKSWPMLPENIEIPAADVILRDGTIIPHDRDSSHYGQQNAYGRIVRELIQTSWNIVKNCREDSQTVVGVVKNAQMRVFSPVINYFLCQEAANGDNSQMETWPLEDMNGLPDQALLSRILTAGRQVDDPWLRTALVLRPFHAATNFGKIYSSKEGKRPSDLLKERSKEAQAKNWTEMTEEDSWWKSLRVPGDPYLQLLEGVWYAGLYLGAFKRLERSETLSRLEFIVPHKTVEEGGFPEETCGFHLGRALTALKTVGFEVASEHAMFGDAGKIDLLPSILVRAHETVKTWARELRDRVSEYMDWHIAKYLQPGERVRLRPWKRRDLEMWIENMQDDRRKIAGTGKKTEQDDG